jgi:hypothetical protein
VGALEIRRQTGAKKRAEGRRGRESERNRSRLGHASKDVFMMIPKDKDAGGTGRTNMVHRAFTGPKFTPWRVRHVGPVYRFALDTYASFKSVWRILTSVQVSGHVRLCLAFPCSWHMRWIVPLYPCPSSGKHPNCTHCSFRPTVLCVSAPAARGDCNGSVRSRAYVCVCTCAGGWDLQTAFVAFLSIASPCFFYWYREGDDNALSFDMNW